MCKIFLAAFSLLVFAPLDGGAAMLVAARASFFISRAKRWNNPYVTDGLVAQYDGEWNAGGGVHDASAKKWRNLAGDSRLDLDITGMVVGDDYVDTNARTSKTQHVLPQTDFTIEIVGASIKKTSWTQIEYWLTYESDGSMPLGFGPTNSWLSMLFYRYGTTAGKCDTSSYDTKGDFTVLNGWSGSSRSSGSQPVFYKNGVQLPFSSWVPRQGAFSASQYNALGIGVKRWANGSVASNTNSMKLCEVRFYNRALTAAEIATNNAIDKARFNLS